VSGKRCAVSWEVQFEIRERGEIISVPLEDGGMGRGVIELIVGSATRREIILLVRSLRWRWARQGKRGMWEGVEEGEKGKERDEYWSVFPRPMSSARIPPLANSGCVEVILKSVSAHKNTRIDNTQQLRINIKLTN